MELLQRLRSSELPSIEKFSIYLPDRDKDREEVTNLRDWIDSAIWLLTEINGGCTELPPAQGAWKRKDGEHLVDQVVVVYSFIRDPYVFASEFHQIAAFIHQFGKETRQESVLVELTGGHLAYFVDESEYQ